MPAEMESPMTTRWSLCTPEITGTLRCESSLAARVSVMVARTIAAKVRATLLMRDGASLFQVKIQIRKIERNMISFSGESGGDAIAITHIDIQAVMFRARSCHRSFKNGVIAIASTSRIAPG